MTNQAAIFRAIVSATADLAKHFGVSRATIWRWAENGTFPKPYQLSPQTTRWRLSDVRTWEAERDQVPARQ